MSNIFTGMLLVFLNFNFNIGRSTIGLIPDFIGYIVMAKGLAELESESEYFEKAKGFAKGMAVFTGILYAMDLFGLSHNLLLLYIWLMTWQPTMSFSILLPKLLE